MLRPNRTDCECLSRRCSGIGPYRIPFERALADGLEVIEAPWVEHVWQVDMRLGQPRNRVAEARTFFFRLADAAGLGTYRRGVRGQTTRLELSDDFAEQVRPLLVPPVDAPCSNPAIIRCYGASPRQSATVDADQHATANLVAPMRPLSQSPST